MKTVGINEIAQQLNVSRNTVSKVMNNRGVVAEKTKERIIQAAIELGYRKLPEPLLERYQQQKYTSNILVLATSPDFSSFWGEIINGITKELVKNDYHCFYNFLTFEQEQHFVIPDLIKTGDIAGIIIMNMYNKDAVAQIAKLGIPTVYYDLPLGVDCTMAKADVVIVEGRESVYQITKHLIENGKTRLGFIGDIGYCKSIEERWRGFAYAHEKMQTPIIGEYCFTSKKNGHFYFREETEGVIEELIRRSATLPDGFICANDSIAYKVMRELGKRGYSVPGDIKVAGFDNSELIMGEGQRLTTVGVPIEEIGMRLSQQILWRIQNPGFHYETIKIYGDVYFRESTKI